MSDLTSLISEKTKVIFVADLYVEDYVGGAELTTQALIDECPLEYVKLKSQQVTLKTLKDGHHCHWVFGNFAALNPELIPTIVGNMKYSILEYDYKYCRFRSPEKHQNITGTPCDCHNQMNGKIISAFFQGAQSLWWMSEEQKERYVSNFPFLAEKDSIVLSSVFDKKTLGTIRWLRESISSSSTPRKGWIVLGSNSWVKGADSAKKWCEDNGLEHEVVWNVSYDEMLSKLANAEGFVYLPAGADTCPRMVIEAKLLGCKLQLNDYVQHKNEDWFNGSIEEIHDYLYGAPQLFWTAIKKIMDFVPTISGYTTTYNCISQGYPFEKCIKSMLPFANEICVVDGGSSDGTWERLKDLSQEYPQIKIKQIIINWNHPRFAVYDGLQKAEARSMCSSDFCWQMDSDEVVHENDCQKIIDLCKKMPKNVDVISLPVIEYWGGPEKVRLDIQPWKWRLSKNLSYITHGIPTELRRFDKDGNLYASEGTDGCDMIHKDSGQRIPHITFHTQETESLRLKALSGDKNALNQYEKWFNLVIENLPGVHHYSWYDLSRKIRTYKNYWTKHWNSLYNKSIEDTANNNMMFNVPWSQVTDEMIKNRATEFKEKLGGWIWHSKWDGRETPHIKVSVAEPK